ncbi:MAG: transcription-repair coupling factor [bacterium]|nr:transcription-repair coupling factor [bacterium]
MMVPTITNDRCVQALIDRLRDHGGVVTVSGLWGSSAPMLAAMAHTRAKRNILYVTAHLEEADEALDDIEVFGAQRAAQFPAWETAPGEGAAAGEIEAERLRICALLAGDDDEAPRVLVSPIAALIQPVPTPQALAANTLRLAVGDRFAPEQIISWAIARGFERLELVESPGDCACRGDIVDVFAPGESLPYRVEFDGERIESLRRFDPSTQRSVSRLERIAVPTPARGAAATETTDFLAYLPADTLVVLDGPMEIQEIGRTYGERMGSQVTMHPVEDVLARVGEFSQMHLGRFGAATVSGEDSFDFDVRSVARFEGASGEAVAELCRCCADHTVLVVCDNAGERQRLAEMVVEQNGTCPKTLTLPLGWMHHGFEWVTGRTIVVGHHEVFRRLRPRQRIRKVHAVRSLEAWTDLEPGDLVVHVIHGIARFKGLQTMRKGDSQKREEYLTLEFADHAVTHVPVSQADLVQKYIGAAGHRPRLSKLGGTRWRKATEKVEDAVSDLAESMLKIQAERETNPGTAYPADTDWQKEFEASFLYEETEDQVTASAEISTDLARAIPMDRLLCGDVGYGKTELAMRASFKVVEYGRQVAVLVPTTVLAEQHYQTFRERLAEYPFVVACLSRFRTKAEQAEIIQQLRKGQVDIVVGTHRLLSKDVGFADLGLLIVDEEQRFGVEHKERLKRLRSTVDVLTLTATPIPRTLHMSMLGLRDICALATPPLDRRSIATQVRPFDDRLVRNAVLREMNRDGQVFFVHNFVQSIAAMAGKVQSIVPEARVIVGHGQMKEGELEEVMTSFVKRRADVLVCTTIIESGIDIPSANTIFINRADRFGLADLHQLRGRVGRSKHRAYCYLLLPGSGTVTPKAAKRLKAIEEFSELGAGFRIAMRDLEIRGAGNILGGEQSGHIAAVGYDLYCRSLERAVRSLKGEPDPTPRAVHLELDVVAHIPQQYITAARGRLEVYRRLVSCRTTADLRQLEQDIKDAFGDFPPTVGRLLELAEIRVLARRWGIDSIIIREPDIVFTVHNLAAAQGAFEDAFGSVRMPDAKTIHLRPPSARYLESQTILPMIRKLLARPVKEEVATP